MSTYFISDLHLDEARPKITDIFLNFLEEEAPNADALYILGDLFERWIGDDHKTPMVERVKKALSNLTKTGIPTYFMHGNRDFLVGSRFAEETGVKLIKDPEVIDLYGTKAVLMHGDTLCTEDKIYQRFRKYARSEFLQSIFLMLPLKKRQKMADKAREKSEAHTSSVTKKIMDASMNEVRKVMKRFKAPLLIHGHTHKTCTQHLDLDGESATRIVLSDWDTKGQVLNCDADGQWFFELY